MTSQQWDSPPDMQIETDRSYQCTLSTDRGDIELELYPEHAPVTVNNFIFLAREGFYDGTSFHRVIADFMIQGGDPTGSGRGGPGYRFQDEFDGNPLRHERGVISMANAGPGTNGSQFFITSKDTPHLDGKHVVFGEVVEGMDVVRAIEDVEKDSKDKPKEDVIILDCGEIKAGELRPIVKEEAKAEAEAEAEGCCSKCG